MRVGHDKQVSGIAEISAALRSHNRDTMTSFVLIACAACAFGNPRFIALSIIVGTIPIAYLVLRPYTRTKPTWGIPRVDAARVLSLILMLLCLVPLWLLREPNRSTIEHALGFAGLGTCCVYLWYRACWLLDVHHVTSMAKEILFPGLLAPAILVLGMTVGSWLLGMLFVIPMWPSMLFSHTLWSIAIGVPTALLVSWGLHVTFASSPEEKEEGDEPLESNVDSQSPQV